MLPGNMLPWCKRGFTLFESSCFRIGKVLAVQWRNGSYVLGFAMNYLSEERIQVFSIGTVAAYSANYSALVAYKILELF